MKGWRSRRARFPLPFELIAIVSKSSVNINDSSKSVHYQQHNWMLIVNARNGILLVATLVVIAIDEYVRGLKGIRNDFHKRGRAIVSKQWTKKQLGRRSG